MGRFSKRLARAHRGEHGFTLIELLIVVAILGILAAVIIPNVSGFLVTGRLNAANTEVSNIKTGVLAYYSENGTYPANSNALTGVYIAGTPTENYAIDPSYGWILSTLGWNNSANTWGGITFQPGTSGAGGVDGKWTR